jgi:hypothetical protein
MFNAPELNPARKVSSGVMLNPFCAINWSMMATSWEMRAAAPVKNNACFIFLAFGFDYPKVQRRSFVRAWESVWAGILECKFPLFLSQ